MFTTRCCQQGSIHIGISNFTYLVLCYLLVYKLLGFTKLFVCLVSFVHYMKYISVYYLRGYRLCYMDWVRD